MKKLRLLLLFILMTACTIPVLAQNKLYVSGKIIDNKSLPAEGVSIIVTIDSITVINFVSSDKNGNYRIEVNKDELFNGHLLIKVQLLGYHIEFTRLTGSQTTYNFVLSPETILLKDVVVKDAVPRLKHHGDTTSYRVTDFATEQDRTIGDVLRRLPGITVEDNGLIKFNGKTVKKLYLDGDDLLDDKYNIGTRTIPQRLVNDIQVLENHQDIKALEGKIFSDDVDINLTFKDEAALKIVGQVQIGGGVAKLYDEDANALSLKKKYKAITEAKFNNTGNLLATDILSLDELETQVKRGYTQEQAQLSAGTGSTPTLQPNRYLFNNSGLLNSANLWKLTSGMQIKTKAYYEYDNQQQNYQNLTTVYTPNGDINYTEIQDNKMVSRNAYADLAFMVNREDYYFNNYFVVKYSFDKNSAYLLANSQPLSQKYNSDVYDVSNELKVIKSPKGKVLTEYYSFLNYRNSPEQLFIDSNAYPGIFNTPTTVRYITQNVNIPTFYANNNITFRLVTDKAAQSYIIGVSVKVQNFDSGVTALSNNGARLIPDSTLNALRWNQYKPYIEPRYELKYRFLRITSKFPVSLQLLQFNNGLNQNHHNLIFEPYVSLTYTPLKAETGLSCKISCYRTDDEGNILQTYNGLVLDNYRSISKNNEIFTSAQKNSFALLLSYKNPAKIIFANVFANYYINTSNSINFNNIDKQLSFSDRELYNNKSNFFLAGTSVSKYVYPLNATVGASYSLQFGQSNQVVNNQVFPFLNYQQVFGIDAKGTLTSKIRYDYGLKYSLSDSRPKSGLTIANIYDASAITNNISFECTVAKNLYIQPTERIEIGKNNSGLNTIYNFVDLIARYTFKKIKTDFQLETYNLLDVTTYQAVTLSSNIKNNSIYPLRGKLVLLKGTFIF